MLSLGIDVGGAYTKAVLLENGRAKQWWLEYIPLWKTKSTLKNFLKTLASSAADALGVTTTAELCDVFGSKREGVIEIIEMIHETLGDAFFMSIEGTLLNREQALASPERLAAANWVASSLLIGRRFPDCLMVDVGSTTTDIIPIKAGKPCPRGRTDFERLQTGELVYTGMLRTPLPCICPELKMGKRRLRLAAENFSIAADVYRALGMLGEDDYSCETPDGRGKDKQSCLRRIARAFCSEVEEMGEDLALEAAEALHAKQVEAVARELKRVAGRLGIKKAVGCGVGRQAIAERAASSAGLGFVDLAEVYGKTAALITPAFAMAVLAAEVIQGGCGR